MFENPNPFHAINTDPLKDPNRNPSASNTDAEAEASLYPDISAEDMELAQRIRSQLEGAIKGRGTLMNSREQPEVSGHSGQGRVFARKPKTVEPAPQNIIDKLLQKVCYESEKGNYWKLNNDGHWISINRHSLTNHLVGAGISDRRGEDEELSQVDRFINRVQNECHVNMCCNIGGYRKGIHTFGDTRILVRNEPQFLTPKKGDWKMLGTVLKNMFGDEQLRHVCGWIKVALDMFQQQSWMAGQILVLCGERQSGKTLFTSLLGHLFGGRPPGKPFSYLTQGTDFNSDFLGRELLTIEDEVSLTTYKARQDFGAKIKDFAVNDHKRLHRKGVEAITVMPMQRLVITLNDEPERMQVLPPLNADMEDKMMLIKVYKQKMPMPTTTPAERKAFNDALVAQLPAFLYALKQQAIPADLVSDRFGVSHYHHPDLLTALQQQSPEEHLLGLIDEALFSGGPVMPPWEGLANEVARQLKNCTTQSIAREAAELLKGMNHCGVYLGRLANKHPGRVKRLAMHGGSQKWSIYPPGGVTNTPAHQKECGQALLAKLREKTGAGSPEHDSSFNDQAQEPIPEELSEVNYPEHVDDEHCGGPAGEWDIPKGECQDQGPADFDGC